jgi:hypothetical protein
MFVPLSRAASDKQKGFVSMMTAFACEINRGAPTMKKKGILDLSFRVALLTTIRTIINAYPWRHNF